jgi:hypothetical protein
MDAFGTGLISGLCSSGSLSRRQRKVNSALAGLPIAQSIEDELTGITILFISAQNLPAALYNLTFKLPPLDPIVVFDDATIYVSFPVFTISETPPHEANSKLSIANNNMTRINDIPPVLRLNVYVYVLGT